MGYTKQQNQAYEAQGILQRHFPASPLACRLLTITSRGHITVDDCARYIAEVQSQPWYRRAFPGATQRAPVAVTTSSGTSNAKLDGSGIGAAPYHREQTARCERMLLHELAHVIANRRAFRPSDEYPAERDRTRGHTHAWRVNYVTLVRHQLGYRPARFLRRSFEAHDLPTNR